MKTHSLLLSASVVATLGWSGLAAAQATSSAPVVKSSQGLEEIVVTAERRSVSLQTTAISASVLSGADLADRGVRVTDELQFVAPSVVINNFGQGTDFNIRGIGKGEHNSQTTTGVITYRDGVPSFPGYFTEEPFYDIKSVEILRGPQGTFAGQNATGGAVFINSNDPIINGGHSGYIQGQAGNFSDIGVQGAVNLPISDTVAARAAINYESRNSFYDITGPWSGGDGALSSISGRIGVLWKPDDAWTVLFKGDYNYIDMGAYPAGPALASDNPPVLAKNDLFKLSANAYQKALDTFGRAILKVDYRFADGMTLRSVTGYQSGTTSYFADLDGTSTGIWTFKDKVPEDILSQELNLISPDAGPFKWVVGGFYQTNNYRFPKDTFIISLCRFGPPCDYSLWGSNDTWNAAGFAQASYELSNGLAFSLGARYTNAYTKNVVNVMQYGLPIEDLQSKSFSGWSGKAAVDWTISADNFLYAFVATGFKPGGLNVPVGFGTPAPFTEETVTSYELGWKTRLLDGHVHLQLNGFYNDYKDFQVIVGYPTFPTFGFELNVPNTTTIYGFEAQIQAVYGALSLDAGLGTANSSLGKFYATDTRVPAPVPPGYNTPCDPKTGPESGSCLNLKGNEQTYAPQLTFNIGAQYEFAFADTDTLTPRVSYSHVSDQWATLFENAARGDKLPARNIWNAQIAWSHGSFVTTLYGTNISDQHYPAALNSGLYFAGPPEQYGLRVMKSF